MRVALHDVTFASRRAMRVAQSNARGGHSCRQLLPPRGARRATHLGAAKGVVTQRSFGLPAHPTYKNVGHIHNKKASDGLVSSRGESSDSAAPTSQLPSAGASERQRAMQVTANEGTTCRFSGCGRIFATKIGRGQHKTKIHRDWRDQRVLAGRNKEQWNEEILARMAC